MVFALFVVLLLSSASASASTTASSANLNAGKIIINTEFNTSDLSFHTFEHHDYDLVKLKGCQLKRDVSEPALPMKSIYLVIPPRAKITDITILSAEKIAIKGEYNILPAQPPVPTSASASAFTLAYRNPNDTNTKFTAQKASVYSSSEMYPGEIFRYTGEGNLRGHKIVSITLFPVQYLPAEKSLTFYTNITLCVNYATTPMPMPTSRMLTKGVDADAIAPAPSDKNRFASIVKKTVSNPDDVDRFAFTHTRTQPKKPLLRSSTSTCGTLSLSSTPSSLDAGAEKVKYVIITNNSLKDAFQPLADWKTKKGVPAKIVSVSSIEANYSENGNDTQERIRNFIRDAHTNWSTEWILLGGDTDVVPCRGAYGYVVGSTSSWTDENIPADLYYSCLDGTWNADNDSIYGEEEDDVDLFPDVYVGRAPVNTTAEVQTFVNKTLTYEKNPPLDYELNMLFLAEKLDEPTSGGDAKDTIDIDLSYVPSRFNITKRYQRDNNVNASVAINEMNAGPHIVNHVGHGSTGSFCVYGNVVNSDADGLSNSPKDFILYTISCYSNAFDSNSLSEHFMNNPNGGSVAYIGNSRYGFFISGNSGNGPSDWYDQEFFHSLFNDSFYHLGETVADSKVAYIGQSQVDGTGMRWLQYAINLLGDPELPIWTDTPQNFLINKPSVISANISQELIIQVLNETTEPVQNATVCIMKPDDSIYNVSETDSSGSVSFSISPTAGTLNVTVTKHNFIPNESAILVAGDETGPGTYPSIRGTHNGTITPSRDINVTKMYTYPCFKTDGHSEFVAFYNLTTKEEISNGTWIGTYLGPYQWITFNEPFTLYEGITYNYTIITGCYPQIIHKPTHHTDDGWINCTKFVDANGNEYNDWIPAIRLE
jgi:hypothetical protein